jgi:DNA-binding NtrC family response regulator
MKIDFQSMSIVVSPNPKIRQALGDKLSLPRWNVDPGGKRHPARWSCFRTTGSDDGVLLLDPMLPDLEPNEFHGIVKQRFPNTQILTLNSHTGQLLIGSSSPTRVIDAGSSIWSIAAEPFKTTGHSGNRWSDDARLRIEGRNNLRGMIGDSEPMQRTYSLTRMVAMRDTTVLVTGESGTGKDLVAQEIHLISPRRKQPFVVVNCSAIPETLLEAELFGYTKGSFTGAVQSRIGRIHAAHGGTLVSR